MTRFLSRRDCLKTTLAAAGACWLGEGWVGAASTPVVPRDRIVRIARAPVVFTMPHKPGKNSRKDHGQICSNTLVRVTLASGVEGIGPMFPDDAIGYSLDELVEMGSGGLVVRRDKFPWLKGPCDAVFLDLVGKLLKLPAAEVLGKPVRQAVPCYDGLIYMRDLDGGSLDVIRDDVRKSVATGHRAFKVKIGRVTWLGDRTKGYDADLAALKAVAEAGGPDVRVLTDTNNTYTREEALRLLRDTADRPLVWLEEMFDEKQADDYRAVHEAIVAAKSPMLLADGESGDGTGALADRIREGLIQVSQPDVHTLGLTRWRDYAAELDKAGVKSAPHTYGNQFRVVESVVLGQVAGNQLLMEDLRAVSPVVTWPNITLEAGAFQVKPVPGVGWQVDPAAYERLCAPKEKVLTV